MAKHPKPAAAAGTGLRIRMYRVGFGDFFLISVPSGGGFAHILVDCGVHAKDLGVMGEAVEQLKKDTGGKLALIIMTHRHADHISGFGSQREVFKAFVVERVWMSWFEDPKNRTATDIQAKIVATATHLRAALAARGVGQRGRARDAARFPGPGRDGDPGRLLQGGCAADPAAFARRGGTRGRDIGPAHRSRPGLQDGQCDASIYDEGRR